MINPDTLVRDKRGSVPTYVIEDRDGVAIIRNQFTATSEVIGPRPYSTERARAASMRLVARDRAENSARKDGH